ncbi:MAG: hypothetical protein QOE55_2608 [Acidobacteriaceae bacterium]|nr:hypothetical protein [Acidobacteriaceae bacterium]
MTGLKNLPLERDQRLSQSLLWTLQRRFFEDRGPRAWSDHTVPHYITNNPFLAHAFGRIADGFLRDWQGRLDPAEPVYIIELGAGTGRFAFQFIAALRELQSLRPPELPPFRYVMTDFTEATFEYWRNHPSLRTLQEEGWLELARFDADGDHHLPWDHLKNPIVVLANYFFDSIPQDAFAIREATLHERLSTIVSSADEQDLSDPDVLTRIGVNYSEQPAPPDYYDNPAFNAILRTYTDLEGAEFTFPTTGLRCLESLSRLSSGRLLLIAGDSARSTLAGVAAMRGPVVNMHGSFSLTVNFHAFGEYVRAHGGESLHTEDRQAYLNVSAFLLGEPPRTYANTRAAFQDTVGSFGPDDFFVWKRALDSTQPKLTLREALAMLRLSRWDPETFGTLFATLLAEIPGAEEADRQQLRLAIERIWNAYYPVGEDTDVAFRAGMILFECGDFAGALELFESSAALCGPHTATFHNLALCHVELGDTARAMQALDEALALDADAVETQTLRNRLGGSV